MDTHPTIDNSGLPETASAEAVPHESASTDIGAPAPPAGDVRFPGEDGGESLAAMAQRDLVDTLQLLAERARYITGATGAAIALRDKGEMTCRASAGSSAPEAGAHLQIDSGLSGESVRTQKTLRCDDAATDPRVNRESCEALGIASVVVMPLVRGKEAIGVFELFSDQPNVFQARDITALERMGAMVFTAMEHALLALQAQAELDANAESVATEDRGERGVVDATTLAADRPNSEAPDWERTEPEAGSSAAINVDGGESAHPESFAFHSNDGETAPLHNATGPNHDESDNILEIAHGASAEAPSESLSSIPGEGLGTSDATVSHGAPLIPGGLAVIPRDGWVKSDEQHPLVRSEVSSLRRCQGCGFPVSGGRLYCLDCERKAAVEQHKIAKELVRPGEPLASDSPQAPAAPAVIEKGPMPAFLHAEPQHSSWVGEHKYTVVALVVALAGVLVFVLTR